jgi:hypothetical protein
MVAVKETKQHKLELWDILVKATLYSVLTVKLPEFWKGKRRLAKI